MNNAPYYKNTIKALILENMDLSDYGIETNLKNLFNVFKSEKNWEIEKYGMVKAASSWFQGLPSACTIPFEYHEIIERLGCSQDYASERYFKTAGEALVELCNKGGK